MKENNIAAVVLTAGAKGACCYWDSTKLFVKERSYNLCGCYGSGRCVLGTFSLVILSAEALKERIN